MTQGEKVRLLRENSKMTREALGNEIGYSPQMIYKIESGEKEPSMKFLNSIINYFKVPISFFIDAVFDELSEEIKINDLESIILNKLSLEYNGRILSKQEREYLLEVISKSMELYKKYMHKN